MRYNFKIDTSFNQPFFKEYQFYSLCEIICDYVKEISITSNVRFPNGKCGVTTRILGSILLENGIKCDIVHWNIKHKYRTKNHRHHVALYLSESEYIIDLTIKQFDDVIKQLNYDVLITNQKDLYENYFDLDYLEKNFKENENEYDKIEFNQFKCYLKKRLDDLKSNQDIR